MLLDGDVEPLQHHWGSREANDTVVPFTVPYDDSTMSSIRMRLQLVQEGSFLEAHAADWSLGVNRTFLRNALNYWAKVYDWEGSVAKLNEYPQFTTILLGLRIHFWYMRADTNLHPDAPTLLLLHGWPGSVWEYHDVVNRLKGRYHLVVPSLPGYGWSDPAERDGLCPMEVVQHSPDPAWSPTQT